MIFPKRDAIYQNLNTSFTNFGELLVDLRENSFTGVVLVSFWEYEGILLLDNGNIVNAIEEINGDVITGQNAVKNVSNKAMEKDGTVSVYSQNGDMVTMLASVAKSEILYKDLSTEFTSLEALITKLKTEDHTGYIEVKFEANQQKGYIFLLAGRVIDALLTARGEEISGSAVLSRILGITSTMSATFSVYRSAVEKALSEGEMIEASYNLPQLLAAWSAIISTIESVVDGLFVSEEFLNTIKDVLVSNADDYPFLDPFAAQFQYKDGEVSFSGEVTKNFNQGIGKSLWDTVETFLERAALDEVDLMGPLQTALDPIMAEYRELIDRFNIKTFLPDLFN
jgi:hypothetical protein